MIKNNKAAYKDAEERLHEICIEDIGEEYRVLQQADDGGTHIVIAFEEQMPWNAREYIPSPFMGWRLIFLIVPGGSLEIFHPLNK